MKEIVIKAIKIGIILSLFTPLVLGPFGLTMSAYPKAVFFRSVIEIVFILYLFLILLDKNYFPKISAITLAVLLFSIILLITSITGINFHRSFFGDPERAEGLILNLHFLAFFLILISVFRKKEEWIKLIKIIVSIGAISSLAALLQKADLWYFYGTNLPDRVSGTLSNPDFFASYAVLNIFLTIFILFLERKKDLKFLWAGIIFLNFWALILSQSRASWVALILGIIALCPIFIWRYVKLTDKNRKIVLFCLLAVAVLLLFSAVYWEQLGLGKSEIFWRFYSIFEFSLDSRADVLNLGLVAFKERPLLGWGSENFSFVFDKYFRAEYLRFIPESIFFDRPHNKVMDLMAGAGILGILGYFFMLFSVFSALYKRRKLWDGENRNPGFFYSIILASLFLSYLFQNLFYFDTICTYLIFYFMLAFINNNFSDALNFKLTERIKFPYYAKIILIVFLSALSLASLYEVNIKPTYASINFPLNVKYESSEPLRAINGYKKSIDKKTIYDKDFRLILSERIILILEKGSAKNNEKEMIETLVSLKPILEKDMKIPDKKYNDSFENLARINERIYIFSKDNGALLDMEDVLKKAINFNSERPEFYLLMGELKILEGKQNEGEEYIKKMESLYPDTYENKTLFYRFLGTAYFKADDGKYAVENFKKAFDMDYNYKKLTGMPAMKDSISFAEGLAAMYCRDLKDFDSCEDICKKTISVYPEYKKTLEARFKILLDKYRNKQ